MNPARLTMLQVRYVNKAFWRNPAQAFFIFAFPLMFLVIFSSLLGNGTVQLGDRTIRESSYYVAAMASFGLITACFNNIAIGLTIQRDSGVLKRINGTPLPTAAFLLGRITHALLVAVLLVVVTAAFGRVAYSVPIPAGPHLAELVVMLVVGAITFCALGLALTALIPNSDAAAPIVNAVILPILFLSGVFIAFGNNTPAWVLWVARVFPVRHFVTAMQASFLGTTFRWTDLVVVAIWGFAALIVAVRFFRWEPRA
jgi:ABC-2 type transport system permease protein